MIYDRTQTSVLHVIFNRKKGGKFTEIIIASLVSTINSYKIVILFYY